MLNESRHRLRAGVFSIDTTAKGYLPANYQREELVRSGKHPFPRTRVRLVQPD